MVLVGSLDYYIQRASKLHTGLPAPPRFRLYLQVDFPVYGISNPLLCVGTEKNNKMKLIAGFTGVALFMILVNPEITGLGYVYQFSAFWRRNYVRYEVVAGLLLPLS